MQLSKQGAIAGLVYEAIYLYSYPDPATGGHPWTIGAGHTSAAGGPKVVPGMVWSLRKALEVYLSDMKGAGDRVERAIERNLTQQAYDGFTNFEHNTGKIAGGTIDDKWNAGRETAALATLNLYVNAAGRRMAGLATRRTSETKMIRDGVYPADRIILRERKGFPARIVRGGELPWPNTAMPEVTAKIPPFDSALPRAPASDNFIVRFFTYLAQRLKWAI